MRIFLGPVGVGFVLFFGGMSCDDGSTSVEPGGGSASSSSSGSTPSGSSSSSVPNVVHTVTCTDVGTGSGTLSDAFGGQMISAGSKSYYLAPNWWHKFQGQSISYNGLSFTVHNPQNASVPSSDGAPMGFPTLYIGGYQNQTTTGSNLPKQVAALTSVPTVFTTNAKTLGLTNFNATYDVWFTASGSPLGSSATSPGAGGAYVMVWTGKPAGRQPRGAAGARLNVTVPGAPGTWQVWVDRVDPPCISYVSATPVDDLSFDLNDFIKDAVTNSYGLKTSMFLSVVFAGFEIWGGGDGLQAKSFCAQVN